MRQTLNQKHQDLGIPYDSVRSQIALVGLIELLLVIWALVGILQSGAPPVEKLIWVIIVLVIPLIGFILWYLMGSGSKAIPGRP